MVNHRRLYLLLVVAYSIVCLIYSATMTIGTILFALWGIYWVSLLSAAATIIPLVILHLIWRKVRMLNLLRSKNHVLAAAATATVAVPAALFIGTWKSLKSLLRSMLSDGAE